MKGVLQLSLLIICLVFMYFMYQTRQSSNTQDDKEKGLQVAGAANAPGTCAFPSTVKIQANSDNCGTKLKEMVGLDIKNKVGTSRMLHKIDQFKLGISGLSNDWLKLVYCGYDDNHDAYYARIWGCFDDDIYKGSMISYDGGEYSGCSEICWSRGTPTTSEAVDSGYAPVCRSVSHYSSDNYWYHGPCT